MIPTHPPHPIFLGQAVMAWMALNGASTNHAIGSVLLLASHTFVPATQLYSRDPPTSRRGVGSDGSSVADTLIQPHAAPFTPWPPIASWYTHSCSCGLVAQLVGNVKTLLNDTPKKLGVPAPGMIFNTALHAFAVYALLTGQEYADNVAKFMIGFFGLNGVAFAVAPATGAGVWGVKGDEKAEFMMKAFGYFMSSASAGMPRRISYTTAPWAQANNPNDPRFSFVSFDFLPPSMTHITLQPPTVGRFRRRSRQGRGSYKGCRPRIHPCSPPHHRRQLHLEDRR